jgi:hypothetical protein
MSLYHFPHQDAPNFISPTASQYPKLRGQYLHRLLVQQAFPDLPERFFVHHLDGIKTNSDIRNLLVYASQAEHIAQHQSFMQECKREWKALRQATGLPMLDRFNSVHFAWLIHDASRAVTNEPGPRFFESVEDIEPLAPHPDDASQLAAFAAMHQSLGYDIDDAE